MKSIGVVVSIVASLVWLVLFFMWWGFATESLRKLDRMPLTANLALVVAFAPLVLGLFFGWKTWFNQESISTLQSWLPLMSIPLIGGICFVLLVVLS